MLYNTLYHSTAYRKAACFVAQLLSLVNKRLASLSYVGLQGAPKNFTPPLCFGGKSRLHFVEEKAKVNAAYYVGSLLPMLVDDCKRLLPFGFVFQQDRPHTAHQTQDCLTANCTDFIAKDQWPPNSPDLNPLDYHVRGAMFQAFYWFIKCQLFLF